MFHSNPFINPISCVYITQQGQNNKKNCIMRNRHKTAQTKKNNKNRKAQVKMVFSFSL